MKTKISAKDYPDQTKGSKLAREVRVLANRLSDEEREEYFLAAMQIIYGRGKHAQTHRRS